MTFNEKKQRRGGIARLNNLKFPYKLLVLPLVATVGFVVILVTNVVMGARQEQRILLVEKGYYPSVQLSTDLDSNLTAIQRGLQDAVASLNVQSVDDVDKLHEGFDRSVEQARGNPVLNRADLDTLEAALDGYYVLARATSLRMIHGETGETLLASLQSMKAKQNAIQETLKSNIKRDKIGRASCR